MSEVLNIERDDGFDRDYIPILGGWEIQTKGKGSTFRIAERKDDGERIAILDERSHEVIGRMARESNAAAQALLAERDALAARLVECERERDLLGSACDKLRLMHKDEIHNTWIPLVDSERTAHEVAEEATVAAVAERDAAIMGYQEQIASLQDQLSEFQYRQEW